MPVSHENSQRALQECEALFDCLKTEKSPPLFHLLLRPNRSLSAVGLAWLMLFCWLMLMLPLSALLGKSALWVMLPFALAVPLVLWVSIRRNTLDGALYERLILTRQVIAVCRHHPRQGRSEWQANPYWVTVHLRPEGGPVQNYLTLKGGGREIELGAFLSPEERETLKADLERALAKAKEPERA